MNEMQSEVFRLFSIFVGYMQWFISCVISTIRLSISSEWNHYSCLITLADEYHEYVKYLFTYLKKKLYSITWKKTSSENMYNYIISLFIEESHKTGDLNPRISKHSHKKLVFLYDQM